MEYRIAADGRSFFTEADRAGPVRLNTESGFDKWNSIRQAAC